MVKRTSLSKKTRFDVFKRDSFTCQYCGAVPPSAVLELDHITPVASGGGNEQGNLITSCFDCNRGKSDGSLAVAPESIQQQMEETRERQEQFAAYGRFLMRQRMKLAKTAREIAAYWCSQIFGEEANLTLKENSLRSIRIFLKKLAAPVIYEAIDIAISKFADEDRISEDQFRYFCGVCWKTIRDREAQ